MSEEPVEDHLSKLSTCWSQVFQAHNGGGNDLSSARQKLLQRYCGAIYRYAKAALRDSAAADEVLQDFAYCFLRGDFQGADPEKGRFRDLVKTVLFHLIVNHQRQRRHERTQTLSGKLRTVELLQDAPGTAADGETAHREAIEQELIDLDLLIYCKSAVVKRFSRG